MVGDRQHTIKATGKISYSANLCMQVMKFFDRCSRFVGMHLNRNATNHAHAFIISLHESRCKPKICYTLFSNETLEPCLKIKHPLTGPKIDVHRSSNGLVCLSYELGNLDNAIYLCNLSIQKHVVLPPTSILCLPCPEYVTCVAFGFHPGLNDCKVVMLLTFSEGNHCIEVEVYGLGSNSWKGIDAITTRKTGISGQPLGHREYRFWSLNEISVQILVFTVWSLEACHKFYLVTIVNYWSLQHKELVTIPMWSLIKMLSVTTTLVIKGLTIWSPKRVFWSLKLGHVPTLVTNFLWSLMYFKKMVTK